ncbi:helix-turn-helix transcriptional regulator [Corynebacterium sp. NPDC060344]|uniref:helix-turn-helix transcriptional regulator n=1 Tax=Corynebacterium sp. NPDC060344 TaxID=3347101 RepID=UPI003656F62A
MADPKKAQAAKVPELSWARTLALVPYLAEQRQLTEASADLGIGYGQINEALKFLAQLELPGVPGKAAFRVEKSGISAKITPAVGLLADPVHLTQEEMSAMLLSLETLESSPMQRDPEVVRSAASKLRDGAPGWAAVADTTPHAAADVAHAEILATVRGAIAGGHVLEIDYRSASGERRVRRVDPVSLVMVEDDPYLKAVDRRGDSPAGAAAEETGAKGDEGSVVKSFRIDRMLAAVDTGEPAERHEAPEFTSDDPHGFLDDEGSWAQVEVDADSTWVADYDPVAWTYDQGDEGFPDGGPYPAWVPAANADRTVGFLLRRWPGVKAVDPVSLPKAVAERARKGLRAYGETPRNG